MRESLKKFISFSISFLIIFLVFKPLGNVYAWSLTDAPVSVSTLSDPSTLFSTPFQIAEDGSGNLYVANGSIGSNVISKYNNSDGFLLSFGDHSNSPTGVAVAGDGSILVADWQNCEIDVYSNTGTYLRTFGSSSTCGTLSAYAIAVDSDGYVYLDDYDNNRIQKYGPTFPTDGTSTFISNLTPNAPNFNSPENIEVDAAKNVYVLDSGNNRVQKFDSSGAFVREFTGNGSAFNYPEGMSVDSDGNVYIADSGATPNPRIQIFDVNGVFKQEITDTDLGPGTSFFNYPTGMFTRDDGRLYVSDGNTIYIFRFDRTPATVTLDPLPSNTTSDPTTSITGTATDDLTNISGVEYSVDSGSYNPCTADDGAFDELSETFTCTISPALTDGSHTIDVRATDGSSNTNSGANLTNYDFSVDTTTPAPTPTNSPTPTPTPTSSNSNSSNSGSSSGSPRAPTCDSSKPNAPDLFQIDAADTGVKIFYTPQSSGVSDYYISYGKNIDDLEYGTFTGYGASSGVLSFNIGYLSPNTRYYFKVRGQNGCMPGNWSNIIAATTNGSTYYKNSLQAVISTAANSVSNARSFIGNLPSLISPTAPPIRKNPLPTNTGSGKNELPVSPPAPAKKCFLWIFCF